MGKFDGNLKKVKTKYEKLTKLQLRKWKLKYHELVMGKISYDLFVDDKAFGFKKNWIIDYKKNQSYNYTWYSGYHHIFNMLK